MIFQDSEFLKNKHRREFLFFAKDTGKKLVQAKNKLSRGEWVEFMENQTPFSARTCQKYMRIFNMWSQLPKAYDMTIDEAFDYLIEVAANE